METAEASALRLPKAVRPDRYDITISTDLDGARFSGGVEIDLRVLEDVDEIVCSAAGLVLSEARLRRADGPALSLDIRLDPDTEQAVLRASTPIPPGRYRLACDFAGEMAEDLRGFYRVRFTDPDGVERSVGCTQLCPNDARRVFPCWDEPEFKAVFAVTIEAADTLAVVANTPERARSAAGEGRVRIEFADTMPMSTYLVAWAIGPFEMTGPAPGGRVPIRVVAVPGKRALAAYALEVAAHAVAWFEAYFGIEYPGEKLDLVALPEFAYGAMENLGCVTFREDLLLCDPDETSVHDVTEVTETIEHEIAHMWFGDLVTMRWWNGVWLNEAFATFMSLRCLDDFRPELARWDSFGRDRQAGLRIDGLHVTRPVESPVAKPDDAFGMLDILTYLKGASVLRMLEQYLGEEGFCLGVRRYLTTHAYGSTDTGDLWDALEFVTSEPVRALMDGWITQGGAPLVTAGQEDGVLVLDARPFAFLPEADRSGTAQPSAIGTGWQVPVRVDVRDGEGSTGGSERVMLDGGPGRLRVGTGLAIVNAGGSGTFRVRYEGKLLERILSDYAALQPIERANLVADTWACVLAGLTPLEDFLALIARLPAGGELDPNVWAPVIDAIGLLDFVAAPLTSPALAAFARRLAGPALEHVGWEPAAGEPAATSRLRGMLIEVLGTVGEDEDVRRQATSRFEAARSHGRRLPASSAVGILPVVVAAGGRPAFEAVRQGYRHPADPLDGQRHLNALAATREPALVSDLLLMSMGEIRSADAPRVLLGLLGNRRAGAKTWDFIARNWEEMVALYPRVSFVAALSGVTRLLLVDETGEFPSAQQATRWLGDHPLDESQRLVDQSLELQAVYRRLVERYRGSIGSLLV